jgi:hypothetical protein
MSLTRPGRIHDLYFWLVCKLFSFTGSARFGDAADPEDRIRHAENLYIVPERLILKSWLEEQSPVITKRFLVKNPTDSKQRSNGCLLNSSICSLFIFLSRLWLGS